MSGIALSRRRAGRLVLLVLLLAGATAGAEEIGAAEIPASQSTAPSEEGPVGGGARDGATASGPGTEPARGSDADEAPSGEAGDAEESEQEIEPRERPFDPWQGIDKNGRIPKVPLPPDITRPQRWRYIPEGRIKPGNIFQRLLVSTFIAPFIFRNGDVGTGFGVGLTDIDFRHQRRREFAGIFLSYTTKGQQRYGIAWRRFLKQRELPGGGVLQEERSYIRAGVQYSKTLTRRFFGFGPDSKKSDETSYLDEAVIVSLGGSTSLPAPFEDLVLDLGVDGQFHQLDDGTVQGVPSTRDAFPDVFAGSERWAFGRIGGGIRWDTRDSQRNPYRGWSVGASFDAALVQTDLEVGSTFDVYATKVFPLPGLFHDGGDAGEAHPPTDTLAFGLFTQATAGHLPFYLLPTLGGAKTQRGFIDGRWRDRASWHASTEYRFWVIPRGVPITRNIRIERIGLAAFYEAGAVSPSWPDIFSSRVAHSYGAGLRVSLERAAIFRVDLGWSVDGMNFAAGFGLTF